METETVFNNFDYIVIGIILLSAFLALMRGFTRELFSLIAWVGAYFIGIHFYEPAVPWVHKYIKNDQVAEWAAMAVVFGIALILLMILGLFVCGFVKGRVLTVIDRSLGFLYGLARGALVLSLVYLGAVMIFWPDIDGPVNGQEDKDKNSAPSFLLEAKTRPLLAFGAKMLEPLLPQQLLNKNSDGSEKPRPANEESSSSEDEKGPIDIDKLFNEESNP
ncbi:MAG: CvpA family protein [Bdellovibrionales bacterium]